MPPGSVVRVKASPYRSGRKNVGRRFRIGYYSQADGLDCIWLVNEEGEYEQAIDHEFLRKFFEVEIRSRSEASTVRIAPNWQPRLQRTIENILRCPLVWELPKAVVRFASLMANLWLTSQAVKTLTLLNPFGPSTSKRCWWDSQLATVSRSL
jgi:hypothetical protein